MDGLVLVRAVEQVLVHLFTLYLYPFNVSKDGLPCHGSLPLLVNACAHTNFEELQSVCTNSLHHFASKDNHTDTITDEAITALHNCSKSTDMFRDGATS